MFDVDVIGGRVWSLSKVVFLLDDGVVESIMSSASTGNIVFVEGMEVADSAVLLWAASTSSES